MLLKNANLTLTCTLLLASASVMPAVAADLAPLPDTSEWRFTIAPYAWGGGITGDVGVFGLGPVDVDIPFSDILENLDFGAIGVAEAHNGTWGVFVDLNYANLSADDSRSRSLEKDLANLDVIFTGEVSAEVEVTKFIGMFMGQWRAVDSEQVTLDLMAGARYWHIDNDITARVTLTGTVKGVDPVQVGKDLSGTDGASWIDPMVGVKSRIDTTTPVYFTGWGMIGGFGVGSDFNWDVMGGVGYQWTDRFATVLGYRALGVDYEDDGFVFDVIQQGVAFGGVINF